MYSCSEIIFNMNIHHQIQHSVLKVWCPESTAYVQECFSASCNTCCYILIWIDTKFLWEEKYYHFSVYIYTLHSKPQISPKRCLMEARLTKNQPIHNLLYVCYPIKLLSPAVSSIWHAIKLTTHLPISCTVKEGNMVTTILLFHVRLRISNKANYKSFDFQSNVTRQQYQCSAFLCETFIP